MTRTSTHPCPCGCGVPISQNRLSCPRSWYRIPKELRDALWLAYRRDGQGSLPHLRAVARCVEWLRDNPITPTPAEVTE